MKQRETLNKRFAKRHTNFWGCFLLLSTGRDDKENYEFIINYWAVMGLIYCCIAQHNNINYLK